MLDAHFVCFSINDCFDQDDMKTVDSFVHCELNCNHEEGDDLQSVFLSASIKTISRVVHITHFCSTFCGVLLIKRSHKPEQ